MGNILHMDTDAVRDFSRWMGQTIEEMKSQVDQTAGSVQSMNWASPGQEQFLAEYEQARAALQRLIQEGEALNQRVSNEINEWETMAQNRSARFSGTVDPSFSFPNIGGWLSTAGVVAGVITTNIKNAADSAPFVIVDQKRPMSEQDDYLLKQFSNYIANTKAGKQLIDDCTKEHLGFRLPDGTVLGDPKGKIVPITIGKVGKTDVNGVATEDMNSDKIEDDPGIVISEEWLYKHKVLTMKGEISPVLAHEMQHQLDYKRNLVDHFDRINEFDTDTANLEKYLSSCVQSRVDTEIRANQRASEVSPNFASHVTAQQIMKPGSPYPEQYLGEINQFNYIGDRYHVSFSVGQNGEVHVRLSPKKLEF